MSRDTTIISWKKNHNSDASRVLTTSTRDQTPARVKRTVTSDMTKPFILSAGLSLTESMEYLQEY
jgi:hypothetical protein